MQDGILYVCPMTNCFLTKAVATASGTWLCTSLGTLQPTDNTPNHMRTYCTTGIEKQTVVDGQQMLLQVQQLQHRITKAPLQDGHRQDPIEVSGIR